MSEIFASMFFAALLMVANIRNYQNINQLMNGGGTYNDDDNNNKNNNNNNNK